MRGYWFSTICLKVFESRPWFSIFNLISRVTRAAGERNLTHFGERLNRPGFPSILMSVIFCQTLPLHLIWAATWPRMTKLWYPELRGMMCGGHRKSRTVRRQVLLSPEFRGGGRLWPASVKSFLPLELYFLVSTLQKVRALFSLFCFYI